MLTVQELVDSNVRLAGLSEAESKEYAERIIEGEYKLFSAAVPNDLTDKLHYVPSTWNVWNMITSSFAHGNWSHIIFNLLFFIAFAVTVEVIVGTVAFIGLFLGSTIFTALWFSVISSAAGENIPTIGLSGVVMTMIALFAFLLPTGRVRCLFWYIFIVKRISIPAWTLATFYIGRDLYYLLIADYNGLTNFAAHVAGAAFGFLIGILFFQEAKRDARSELAAHQRR